MLRSATAGPVDGATLPAGDAASCSALATALAAAAARLRMNGREHPDPDLEGDHGPDESTRTVPGCGLQIGPLVDALDGLCHALQAFSVELARTGSPREVACSQDRMWAREHDVRFLRARQHLRRHARALAHLLQVSPPLTQSTRAVAQREPSTHHQPGKCREHRTHH